MCRLILVGMLLLMCTACGRKAPPVPPRFDGLTPPAGVTARVQEKTLIVAWSDPSRSEWRLVTGYRIYLSTLKQGEESCKGCPVRFEKVGDAGAGERQFRLAASPGVLYTFEVRATAEGGYLSDPSKRVVVDLREGQ
ncbi:fibronectin type III domain-containing protein [Desulfoluna sp.]|uniref:fibronectin type III domain-containing protein n=1 Tax=Desulfoluna sp. TaxID=2045199 RepID=UPI002635A405|nr:fibronectin type III domain-containing protein [Desulfoluna sp.]